MRKPALPALALTGLFVAIVAYQFASSPPEVTPPALAARLNAAEQHVLDDPSSPMLGNPRGNVTVVEFFDYRCPYCRLMQPKLQALLAGDPQIRLVMKEWPVFGGPSVEAARIALASAWQGKYAAVHDALFAAPLPLDQVAIRQAARQAGADMDRLDQDMALRSSELDRMLTQSGTAARALGLPGTPAFVVGSTVIPSALSLDDLKGVIATARTRSDAMR
ncbi:MAG: DsbA family protein [Acetobacteraceae bacterium]|nr:DsbA family protein [Acetobacteraceae bacterium]